VEVLTTSNFPLGETVLRQMAGLSGAEFAVTEAAAESIRAASFPSSSPLRLPTHSGGSQTDGFAGSPSVRVGADDFFHTAVPLPGRHPQSEDVLHVLLPVEEHRRARAAAIAPPLGIGAATFAMIAIVGLRTARAISATASSLGDEVRRLARGDYRQLALPSRDDELRALGEAVNQTARQLAGYEAQVRSSERLQTLATLGAALAHELRNSATGLRLALELHAEQCRSAAAGHSLQVARRQLNLMERQLQRFLEAAGGASRERCFAATDLRDVVREAAELVGPAARHAGVALHCQLPPGPLTARADRELLTEAVRNLALNGLEAAQRGEPAAGAERRVTLELAAEGAAQAAFAVRDSGRGPDPRHAARIFEPFVTDKPEGAGLGLSIVRQTAAVHGGDVDWRRRNATTEFRLVIPLFPTEPCHVSPAGR